MLKYLVSGIGVFVLVAALFLAFFLVPAHVQIRNVSPALPSKSDIEKLKNIPNGPIAISYILTATQKLPQSVGGHSSFVIEWENGRMLLIDAGMDKKTAIEFGEVLESVFDAEQADFVGTLPDILGSESSKLKGAAFTHLHVDHVQGIETICAALEQTVSVLHTPDQMMKHNFGTEDQFELLEKSSCVEQSMLAKGSHSKNMFPGIGIFPLGGHTPGSTLFAVPVGDQI